jgi:hypothetical protein
VTRFVVDADTLLRIAAGEIEVAPEHQLLAPTLVRSQALSALYEAARRGEVWATDGLERVTSVNSLKVRFLGTRCCNGGRGGSRTSSGGRRPSAQSSWP